MQRIDIDRKEHAESDQEQFRSSSMPNHKITSGIRRDAECSGSSAMCCRASVSLKLTTIHWPCQARNRCRRRSRIRAKARQVLTLMCGHSSPERASRQRRRRPQSVPAKSEHSAGRSATRPARYQQHEDGDKPGKDAVHGWVPTNPLPLRGRGRRKAAGEGGHAQDDAGAGEVRGDPITHTLGAAVPRPLPQAGEASSRAGAPDLFADIDRVRDQAEIAEPVCDLLLDTNDVGVHAQHDERVAIHASPYRVQRHPGLRR